MANPTNTDVTVELFDGIGKESKKPYTAIKVKIGDYEPPLIFTRSKFELDYVKSVLNAQ